MEGNTQSKKMSKSKQGSTKIDPRVGGFYTFVEAVAENGAGLCPRTFNPLPDDKFLDSSKLKEFADDNFKFDENGKKLSKRFKSKRYRDKLRTEVKALEGLLPVDRPALHRKLDSQTVYRLVIAFLRMKNYFKHVDMSKHTDIELKDTSTERKTAACCKNMEDKLLKEINLFELAEGFVIMLSIDGTIIFVSENVVNFNGFNQVDLIHRCLYGIIHPEDHIEVRNILEGRGLHSYNRQMRLSSMGKTAKMSDLDDAVTSPSFFCRMKCFVGNTAGYMKVHCSGKLQTVRHLPSSSKMADRVAILFCQPFVFNGNDVTCDSKDNVFWSKHDLDLTFKETERKITDILGYDETELCNSSMYHLVHVEDLHTLVTVHKSITEVSDVQSFFMRLKHKDDRWMWLHCKGKVISKNSKKFSIVFTHTPIRDENSAFLQQEIILRQKHSLRDLFHLTRFHSYQSEDDTDTGYYSTSDTNCKTSDLYSCHHGNYSSTQHYARSPKRVRMQESNYLCESFESPCDEVSLIFNPMTFVPVPCPSTWHATLDRHSPVVPSSHVAHKLCLKEKQLQYAQFKRTQQSSLRQPKQSLCTHVTNQSDTPVYFSNINNQNGCSTIGHRSHGDSNSALYKQSLYLYNVGPLANSEIHYACNRDRLMDTPQLCHSVYQPKEFYNYPPSPPPSPWRHVGDKAMFNSAQYGVCQENPITQQDSCHSTTAIIPQCVNQNPEKSGLKNNSMFFSNQVNMCNLNNFGRTVDPKLHNQYQSHANVKFSMILNSSFATNERPYKTHNLVGNQPNWIDTNLSNSLQNNMHGATISTNQIKCEPGASQSCSLGTDSLFVKSQDRVQYDVEASIHMKIVETELTTSQPYPEVEIPTFENFMDYLTNEKIY